MKREIPRKVVLEIKKVNKLTDNLNTPIDEEVKLIVAVLRVIGFNTIGSCAGHNDDRTPWIDFSSKESNKFLNSNIFNELVEKINNDPTNPEYQNKYDLLCKSPAMSNILEGVEMLELLNRFYKNRSTQEEVRLILEVLGWQGLGGIRLKPQGDSFVGIKKPIERAKWLNQVRVEMNEFANFLYTLIE